MAHSPGPLLSAPQTDAFSPHRPLPWHPPAGPVCLVFWADRGPGASCPYVEGPRRALVTFPRWKVTRGSGLCSQARFDVSRRRRLLGRDGAAPQSYLQARFDISRRRRLLGRDSAAPPNCIILPVRQCGLSVRTHSSNPTFSFRPAEKRTCR